MLQLITKKNNARESYFFILTKENEYDILSTIEIQFFHSGSISVDDCYGHGKNSYFHNINEVLNFFTKGVEDPYEMWEEKKPEKYHVEGLYSFEGSIVSSCNDNKDFYDFIKNTFTEGMFNCLKSYMESKQYSYYKKLVAETQEKLNEYRSQASVGVDDDFDPYLSGIESPYEYEKQIKYNTEEYYKALEDLQKYQMKLDELENLYSELSSKVENFLGKKINSVPVTTGYRRNKHSLNYIYS